MIAYFIKFAAIILTADFISGLFHWWEDAYGNPNWKILGKHVVEPNLLHHSQPRAFLKGNYWQRNNTAIISAIILITIPFLFGWFNWFYFACIGLASQSNEVHRKAHQSDKENGVIIQFLQKIGVMQSRKHHGWHHKAPYDCNYCILTDYLNPILERIHFFPALEYSLSKLFKIHPLRASSVRKGR